MASRPLAARPHVPAPRVAFVHQAIRPPHTIHHSLPLSPCQLASPIEHLGHAVPLSLARLVFPLSLRSCDSIIVASALRQRTRFGFQSQLSSVSLNPTESLSAFELTGPSVPTTCPLNLSTPRRERLHDMTNTAVGRLPFAKVFQATMIKKECRTQAQGNFLMAKPALLAPPAPMPPRSKRTQYPSSRVIDPANVADVELRSHRDAISARRMAAAAEPARGQDMSHTTRSTEETSGLDNHSLASPRTPQITVAPSLEPATTSKRAGPTTESDDDSGNHSLIRHRSKKSRNSIVLDESDEERNDTSQTRKLPKPGKLL
ncbi:hypothetical protein EDB89DRAFT_1904741 [Lactarius sanguifluus]|nr:hypothetical protein EDB89DRAFT_1904741 [Lactarius sanguifluus]